MRRLLILCTALSPIFGSAAFGATLPIGTATGTTVYFPPDSSSADGCPCGADAEIAKGVNTTGSWTLSGGQTFSLTEGAPNDPNAASYLLVGRKSGANGTVTLTGAGTTLTMSGNNNGATAQVGREGGTGTLNVHDGATFAISDPNSLSEANDDALHLGESGGTGTLDVNAGTVSLQTGTGGSLYIGANQDADAQIGGHGIANIANNSTLTLRDLASANPPEDDIGAQVSLGQMENSTGELTVDHSTVTIDAQDSEADLLIGQKAGSTGTAIIQNHSTVTLSANSANTAKGSGQGAYLTVGQGTGSTGSLDVSGGSTISMSGPIGQVLIGYKEGSNGEMTLSDGSTFTNTAADQFVQIGQNAPATANGGVGSLTVSGAGSKFDTTGGIQVGQSTGGNGIGTSKGTLKVENGGEVTADHIYLDHHGTLMGNGGTVNADVNLNAGGAIAPGASPGSMTINGDLTSFNGILYIQIAGTNPSDYDHLIVNGDLIANTPLAIQVNFLNSFVPQVNDTFDFLQVLGLVSGKGFFWRIGGYAPSDFQLVSNGGSFSFKTVAVGKTPIPASLPLFASALGGLGYLGWRRRKSSAA